MSRPAASHADPEVVRHSGDFSGIRVLELADEQAEYCGLLLASLGATVVKVEPTGGSRTRNVAPFLGDEPGPERSLYFWAYNRGKQSLELDLDAPEGRKQLHDLIRDSDVFLESMPAAELQRMDISHERLANQFPHVISARVSPFGDAGPWSSFKGSDLIHLALGGQMMNCGYDREALTARMTCHRSRHRCGTPTTSPGSSCGLDRHSPVPSRADRPRAAPVARRARGGREEHRARSLVLADAQDPALPTDLPTCRGHAVGRSMDHSHQGRALDHDADDVADP